jgi:polycystin 1L2
VNDLAKRTRYFFICEQWLAVEKEDGLVERRIKTAGHKEKTQLTYLFKKETQSKLSDGHLRWFSLLARPVQSTFSRLDRLTCIFVLMVVSMLANIIYYGTDTSSSPNALKLGPFMLTPMQVWTFFFKNINPIK